MLPVEPVEEAALDALRSAGLTVERQPDGHVALRHDDASTRYALDLTPGDLTPRDVARLGALPDPRHTLVLAGHVPRALGAHLRERGIPYADAAGNLWFRAPGALLWVEGRPRADIAPARRPPVPPLNAAAIQALFILLRDPTTLDLSLRALAERAGVSHMAVQNALRAAEARGWIRTLGRKQRALVDAPGLLNAWLEGFAAHLDADTVIARATPVGASDVRAWAAAVDARGAWGLDLAGGELGATRAGCEILSPYGSIWVAAWDADTMRRLRVAPSPRGPLVVRRAFTHSLSDDGTTQVDPLLLLGELYSLPDARLDGTRAALRARVQGRWAP